MSELRRELELAGGGCWSPRLWAREGVVHFAGVKGAMSHRAWDANAVTFRVHVTILCLVCDCQGYCTMPGCQKQRVVGWTQTAHYRFEEDLWAEISGGPARCPNFNSTYPDFKQKFKATPSDQGRVLKHLIHSFISVNKYLLSFCHVPDYYCKWWGWCCKYQD